MLPSDCSMPMGSNKDKGPAVTKVCANSCIACGMCERTCKKDAIHVVNNVAVCLPSI